MKSKKEEMEEILEEYKAMINFNTYAEPVTEIELFIGQKPDGYYVPNVLEYLSHPPYSKHTPKPPELVWFVEIWINRICIWREHDDKEEEVDNMLDRIKRSMMIHGISSNYNVIKNLRKSNHYI